MKTIVDQQLRDEAQGFRFCFTCSRCVHFDPERRACGEGYPVEPHDVEGWREQSHVFFCKSFELW